MKLYIGGYIKEYIGGYIKEYIGGYIKEYIRGYIKGVFIITNQNLKAHNDLLKINY